LKHVFKHKSKVIENI